MAPQDPLRQLMSMADRARKDVDSMISQGTRSVQSALPQLPLPGAKEFVWRPELPGALPTEEFLKQLPKLPELPVIPGLPALPGQEEPEARRFVAPSLPLPTPVTQEVTTRSMGRQVPLRPLNRVGIGRRF